MKSTSVLTVILCAFFFCSSASSAQAQDPDYVTISGTVSDALGGHLLPGVSVALKGQPFSAQTNRQGRYAIAVPRSELDTATLVFTFFNYLVLESRLDGTNPVNVALNRLPPITEGRQSSIHFNAYTCIPTFGEFDASCSPENYFTFELRWVPRYNRAPGQVDMSRMMFSKPAFWGSSSMMDNDNRNGQQGIGGGIILAGDRNNSTPPPPKFDQDIQQSAAFGKEKSQIASTHTHSAATSDSSKATHDGFYSLMFQLVKPLASPIDSKRLSVNAYLTAGVSWIKQGVPTGDSPTIESKFGIPTLGYGAEFVFPFKLGDLNRFSARLQLQGIIYYPRELNYIYRVDSPNSPEGFVDVTVPQAVQSHRKLNLLFGFGYILAD